ncbi:MAG: acetyltransferase [Halomonadaceae bacterium]
MIPLPVVLLGAGGHAKVTLDLLHALGRSVLGVCDPKLVADGVVSWRGLSVLGGDEAVRRYSVEDVELVNGIGSVPGSSLRKKLHMHFTKHNYRFATLVHPSAILGVGVSLGNGVQIMAGAIVQADTQVQDNTILNTGVRVDHDCLISQHTHIAPGAILSGGVVLEEGVHIGPGATLTQGIRVGASAVIGAGTPVVRNVPARHQLTGLPPRAPYLISS